MSLCLCVNQTHVVVFLGNALHVGSNFLLYEFTKLNLLSVRFQLPPRTLHTLIDWLIEHPHTALGLTLGQRNA